MAIKDIVLFNLTRHPFFFRELLHVSGRGSAEKLFFLSAVRPGDIVFDVGANRGHYSTLFSRLCGPTGSVHSFEASPYTMSLFRDNLSRAKRYDNVRMNNNAIGESTGSVRLFMPGDDDGQASLKKHDFASWSNQTDVRSFECSMIRLDDYISANQIHRLDFLKIDIEGAELGAIRGFSQGLANLHPLISLEVCPEWMKDFSQTPDDLSCELQAAGYDSMYHLKRSRQPLFPITDIASALAGGEASIDVVFAKSNKHSERIQELVHPAP